MKLVNNLREYAQMLKRQKEDKARNIEEQNTYVTIMVGDTKDTCRIGNLRIVEVVDKNTTQRKLMLIKRVVYNEPLGMMNAYVSTSMSIFFDVLEKTIINVEELSTLRFYDFREIFPFYYLKGRNLILTSEEVLSVFNDKLNKSKVIG